jgi:outer membrane lipopolysaccharide assembly protein LptE/RlpB
MQSIDRIRLRPRWSFWFVLFAALAFSGCGYHFPGTGTGLPPDVRTVAIPIFANRTLQTGVETEMAPALSARFISAARFEVTDRASADALLTGAVKSIDNYPVAVSGGTVQSATQYRLTMVVEMTFSRPRDGKVFWKGEVSDWRIYSVDSSLAATENNKQEAIRQISALLAEKAYSIILDNF